MNLNLNDGQILGLLGPNGVGKSTIFNLITGLISPDYGSIIINSEKVNKFPILKEHLSLKLDLFHSQEDFSMTWLLTKI